MQQYSYVNGEYTTSPMISITDLGLMRGFGVFDFLRTYGGRPFHLTTHLNRLRKSAQKIGLDVQASDNEIAEIIRTLMDKNHLHEASVRMMVTGGISEDHISPADHPSFIVMVFPPSPPPGHYYIEGIRTITCPITRFLPECKSLNYLPAILALQKAKKANAVEAFYIDNDHCILEGTTSNFFAWKGHRLITPGENILSGVTREIVLHLAKKNNIPLETRSILYEELKDISEAFLSASNKEILPISQIDTLKLPVGPQTQRMMQLFREYTKSDCWTSL
ncbi:MAG: aminotransferase class IV [Parachlamydiales bacterium]|nr:aminotransferase class IV [Parachlamydiales bacterium]